LGCWANPGHFSRRGRAAGNSIHRRQRKGRHTFHPQQWTRRQEVSAGNAGRGRRFFDADGDSWPDILLINSKDWTPRGRKSLSALYRNNHDGTFTNITAGSGLDIEMYGMAWPSAITIMTAAMMSTSPHLRATAFFT